MPDQPINFDRAADFYDETRGFPAAIADKVGAFLARAGNLSHQASVLEVGIGTGRVALPLIPHVNSIYGVDLSRKMMQVLRRKQTERAEVATGRIHVAQADAMRLPFADNAFDAVVTVHVFHLITQPQTALEEIKRVLKPDGVLLHAKRRFNPNHDDVLANAWSGVRATGQYSGRWDVSNTLLPDSNWRQLKDDQQMAYTDITTPQDWLDRITKRQWSSTWHLPDDAIAEGEAALRKAIDDHYDGDVTYRIETEASFYVQVYAPPL